MPYDYELTLDDIHTFPVRDNTGVLLNSINDEPYKGKYPTGKFSIWYENGMPHREQDKPAIITSSGVKQWYLHGAAHRVNGPQKVFKGKAHAFMLFGLFLTGEQHTNIIAHSSSFKCPLWMSLFVNQGMVNEETFRSFLNAIGVWECVLPFDWVIKVCGVDDELLKEFLGPRSLGSNEPHLLNYLVQLGTLPAVPATTIRTTSTSRLKRYFQS